MLISFQMASPWLYQPGSRIDHFLVVRPIDRGGMAEVYLARDTTLGRKVALKVIQPGAFESDDEWLKYHRDVPEAAVGMAEWQADQFAGLVLVPPARLSEVTPPHFREVARRIREEGQEIDLTCDPVWSVIANRVAKPFEVSAQTAEICLKRDGLWGMDLSG